MNLGTTTLKTPQTILLGALVAALGAIAAPASAQSKDLSWGIYGQFGSGLESRDNPHAITLGVTNGLPWSWQLGNSKIVTYWDAYLSQWRAPAVGGGDKTYLQIGIIPSARLRFDNGNSPWFFDAGIGATYLDDIYATPRHTFSTRFQFTEFLSVGRSFGDAGQHELSLRVQHFSNAGIDKPNPGENFIQLRYGVKF